MDPAEQRVHVGAQPQARAALAPAVSPTQGADDAGRGDAGMHLEAPLRKAVGNETAGGELVEAEFGVLMNRLSPRLHRSFVGDESINGIHGSIIGFGHALLVRARLALATLDKAREEIRLLRGGAGARVAIALTPLVAATVLPRVLAEFHRIQPDAALSLDEGLLTSVLPGLIEGRLDFAIALANPQDLPYEINFEALAEVPAAPAGRIGHPLAAARSWAELQGASWVLNLAEASQGNHLVRWLAANGIDVPANAVRCVSSTLMLELMRRTDHIRFGPHILLRDPMFGTGLQRFAVEPLPPPMSLGILSLRGVPLSVAAKPLAGLFARHLRA